MVLTMLANLPLGVSKIVTESELLKIEGTLADAGYNKIRSEYVRLLYRASWTLNNQTVDVYQVEPSSEALKNLLSQETYQLGRYEVTYNSTETL